jgi:hypothetical protein
MSNDAALVFQDETIPAASPGTHVLIVGVGKYAFGKGGSASTVAGDLRQLSSPPVTARALADWFIETFRNSKKPLASVSLLVSEAVAAPYVPPRPAGAAAVNVPSATLANVKQAAGHWADRLRANQDNLAVFCFCGHGASLGQQAALLLEDFGAPGADFDAAVDVDILRGTMKNSPAIQQTFLFDCCRTKADDLYRNEPSIGSRIVSIPAFQRGHAIPPQQFVLFPTIDGEEAFGIKGEVSVFSRSILDALSFAAADSTTGVWRTTTGSVLSAVDQLVRHRLPELLTKRSKPNALDATSFDFNEIPEPTLTRSLVTISDLGFWGQVELEAVDAAGGTPPQRKHSRNSPGEMCCMFELPEGKWRFGGVLPASPPSITIHERTLRAPVAYVKLEVAP